MKTVYIEIDFNSNKKCSKVILFDYADNKQGTKKEIRI